MRLALYDYDHGFRILERRDFVAQVIKAKGWDYPFDQAQEPWAVLEDFDGDGRRDAALLGTSGDSLKLLFVSGDSISPRVESIHARQLGPHGWRGPIPWYLRQWRPHFPVGSKKGVELVFLRNAALTYVCYDR
jgi:hypothetical protein